jgi:hypothetical protein
MLPLFKEQVYYFEMKIIDEAELGQVAVLFAYLLFSF